MSTPLQHSDSDPAAISADFRARMPVASQFAYFDHAAVSPLPDATVKAMTQYASEAGAQGDLGWLEWAARVENLRDSAARLISADKQEIALVSNTTQGINLIAEGFPWEEGDNIVVPANEFPSNLLPWRNLRRRGVEIREVNVPASGEIRPDDLRYAMDSRTRILSISWVGYASGYRIDVSKIVELAHSMGCLVFLDAIQALGAFPLSVVETGVDFLCADGHKWLLGPEGAGLLFVKSEHLQLLTPLGLGWNSLSQGAFTSEPMVLKDSASRYEGGTMNMGGMLGLNASLSLLLEMKCTATDSPIARAILNNVEDLAERLRLASFEVELPRHEASRSGILSIGWHDATENQYVAARKHLLRLGIITSVRGGKLRASPHAYNNSEDNDRLVQALIEFRRSET